MFIGIDIGGSTTKIIGISNGELIKPTMVRANDPVASLFGAFGKFINDNGLSLNDVERVMLTGVGASHISKPMYGLPTSKVEEFLANGLGGLHLSGLSKAVIVSMGTGTAIVKANEDKIEHIGGTGVGGGTIIGLANRMINIRDIQMIIKTAEEGELANIDLLVGDLTKSSLPGLPADTTASNFGRVNDLATHADIALGILNLVFQSIGMTAVFAVKNSSCKDVVLIGNLTTIPQCAQMFSTLGKLFDVNFIIPENSEFGTALGAALTVVNGRKYEDLK